MKATQDEKQMISKGTTLPTRMHPYAGKTQYRYVDNRGAKRWGPAKGTRGECWGCGCQLRFVQLQDGAVWSVCDDCGETCPVWWPARAYETRHDGRAAWRRALRCVVVGL